MFELLQTVCGSYFNYTRNANAQQTITNMSKNIYFILSLAALLGAANPAHGQVEVKETTTTIPTYPSETRSRTPISSRDGPIRELRGMYIPTPSTTSLPTTASTGTTSI